MTSDISCAVKRGQASFREVMDSSIRGPWSQSAATMVMSEYASLPLPSLGAPLEASLWQVAQLLAVNTVLPRAALPVPRKYCFVQINEIIWRISSGSKVGGGFFMLGWWFHMSTAISVRVWFLSSTSRARLPTWHSVQPLEENSFSPESDGGKEKFVARLRVSGRFCR